MLSFENISEEILVLEDHFADRLAAHADGEELTTIFTHIKYLKQLLDVHFQTRLEQPRDALPISEMI